MVQKEVVQWDNVHRHDPQGSSRHRHVVGAIISNGGLLKSPAATSEA
jgi:hypothetical protein